jgi:predicted nucleotidyltransferase component of viral defense system
VEEHRLVVWESLFRKALQIVDSVSADVLPPNRWSFGGGTVLMRRYCHRFSKDIDIFVPDPQYLGHLSPRLNDTVEAMSTHYNEQANFIKLYFPEGEIDIVAAGALTHPSTRAEIILGREVQVETSAEILAKKIYHRAREFTARDLFDFALIAEKEPSSLSSISNILRDRRDTVLARINANDATLRLVFAQLDVLEYQRSYDECVDLVKRALLASGYDVNA